MEGEEKFREVQTSKSKSLIKHEADGGTKTSIRRLLDKQPIVCVRLNKLNP